MVSFVIKVLRKPRNLSLCLMISFWNAHQITCFPWAEWWDNRPSYSGCGTLSKHNISSLTLTTASNRLNKTWCCPWFSLYWASSSGKRSDETTIEWRKGVEWTLMSSLNNIIASRRLGQILYASCTMGNSKTLTTVQLVWNKLQSDMTDVHCNLTCDQETLVAWSCPIVCEKPPLLSLHLSPGDRECNRGSRSV